MGRQRNFVERPPDVGRARRCASPLSERDGPARAAKGLSMHGSGMIAATSTHVRDGLTQAMWLRVDAITTGLENFAWEEFARLHEETHEWLDEGIGSVYRVA